MKMKHWKMTLTGAAAFIVLATVIYRTATGKDIGLNDIASLGAVTILFLSALTWGTKEDRDGVREDEELGRRITEQSSKVGYFILTLFILVAVGIDQWVHEKPSLLLLLLLGLSMVTLPFIEWVHMRRYRTTED
ncbi:hypothetical protein ACINKY_14140 [Paenibacillus illinoisensis]|uniref:DUF2178 domain-containing protein n=1 Tax=Paenibacillus illinoisensis TaxID=59845 RepID=A0ABW8HUL3_9BACL